MRWYYLKDTHMSRKDAKIILKSMREIINRYGFVTKADFHDLNGSWVYYRADEEMMLYSLRGARISLIKREGRWRIKLPDFVNM